METHLTDEGGSVVRIVRGDVTYIAGYRDRQLRELTITSDTNVTSADIRATPLTELHARAAVGWIDEIEGEPTSVDRQMMTVDTRAETAEQLRMIVQAFTIAEKFDRDHAVDLVAEANGVNRSTAHRWRAKARDAGAFTPDAVNMVNLIRRQVLAALSDVTSVNVEMRPEDLR